MATAREHATGNTRQGNQRGERANTYNATGQGPAATSAHTRTRKRRQQAPKAKCWRQPSSIHIFCMGVVYYGTMGNENEWARLGKLMFEFRSPATCGTSSNATLDGTVMKPFWTS